MYIYLIVYTEVVIDLIKEVKVCGNSCHVYVPRDWEGKYVRLEIVENGEDLR